MDFEEFRKQKIAKKQAEEQQKEAADRPAADGQKLDWVDGFGPSGPKNPKVKGFVLGRFSRRKVDPSTLERPKGYERTRRTEEESEAANKSAAEVEMERRRAALAKAEADLAAAEEKRRQAEIEERRKKDGISRVKGIQKY